MSVAFILFRSQPFKISFREVGKISRKRSHKYLRLSGSPVNIGSNSDHKYL